MMTLAEAAAIVSGKLHGDDDAFDGVVIDSRHAARGDLFVAIASQQSDGHNFIAEAKKQGAVGALVRADAKDRRAQFGQCTQFGQIDVDDTTAALGKLAANWRQRFDLPLLAITGSNGKTTVTAMVSAILNQGGNCLSPQKSFNNQWGVPLTLLRLRQHHTHAVIEMGMNHPGELEYLGGLAQPDIALINNVAPAHLAGLADLRGVAKAKAEIFSGLTDDGVAVLNVDDSFYDYWRECIAARQLQSLSFGMNQAADAADAADVSAADISVDAHGSAFELHIKQQHTRVRLPILGRHNVGNAIAAAAVTTIAGAGLAQIKAGLESCAALNGRLHPHPGWHGALILDDSYNANPASSNAALDVLAGFDGERIAVFGAMAELGAQSDSFHYEVGAHARRCGIQRMLCLGVESSAAMAAYRRGFGAQAACFSEIERLLAHLQPMLASGVTVLVKGSRSAGMERVVAALTAHRANHRANHPPEVRHADLAV